MEIDETIEELDIYEIKQKLIDQGVYEKKIHVSMSFLDLKVESVVKDSFGYIFQGWLAAWFKKNNIYYSEPDNSQTSPDFFLNKKSKKTGLVELKCFYKSPNFDLHGWEAFQNLLIDKPYHIDADFIIFEYNVHEKENYLTIENIMIRKIWEVSKKMTSRAKIQWPINVQYKSGVISNLRTCGLYDLENCIHTYNDRKSYLEAIQKAIDMYDKSRIEHCDNKWFNKVSKKYHQITGEQL